MGPDDHSRPSADAGPALRPLRQVRLGSLTLILLVVLAAGLFAGLSHRVFVDDAESDLERLSLIVADNTSRLIEAVDQVLIAISERRPLPASDAATFLPELMQSAIAGMPMIRSVVVADAAGVIRFNARPDAPVGLSLDDRDYFQRLRDDPAAGLQISAPLAGRIGGARIIVLARRLAAPDGGFAGIVAATLWIEHFERLYASITPFREGGTLALLRRDGAILARHPPLPAIAANPPSGLAARMEILARDGRTVQRVPGPIDGVPRILAWRPLLDGRLVLAMTASEAAVLRPWWRGVTLAAALAAAMIAAILVNWRFLAGQLRRSAAITAALRSSDAELRRRNRELRTIYDGTPVGLCLYDRDLRYIEVNANLAAAHGVTPDRLVGSPLRAHRPEIADKVESVLQHVLATGEPVDNVEFHRDQDGQRRSWLASYRALRDDHDAIVGVAASLLDITDLRQAEAAQQALEASLRRSEKLNALGELTGGLAHDFNNLLTIMLGNVEILREIHEQDAESLELLQEVRTAAQRGGELTRSLLAFARRQPLAPQPIDVNALVDATAKLLRRTLGERIEIRLQLAADLPRAVADRAQLESALTNLATNARDAMPRGGALTYATGCERLDSPTLPPDVRPGDYVVITVTDEGTGMAPEVRARLFEPFFTTKKPGAGTGLGLSMLFGFVKQSGGHVEVDSEVGFGTTFRLYLPVEPAAVAPADAPPEVPMARASGERVLVVEDDDALRRIVARQVAGLGYEVVQAANAGEALAVLERGEPVDLVFCDVVMPGRLDGYDVADAVARCWPRVRVLLTSGFPGSSVVPVDPGRDGVPLLSKPYRREALAQALRDALDAGRPAGT